VAGAARGIGHHQSHGLRRKLLRDRVGRAGAADACDGEHELEHGILPDRLGGHRAFGAFWRGTADGGSPAETVARLLHHMEYYQSFPSGAGGCDVTGSNAIAGGTDWVMAAARLRARQS